MADSGNRRGLFNSIATLVIVGFTATSLPLIIALIVGSVQVNDLSTRTREAMLDSVTSTRYSEHLVDELLSMERNARQYAVLDDPALLSLYKDRYRQLQLILEQLRQTGPGEEYASEIESIETLASEVSTIIADESSGEDQILASLATFRSLHDHASKLRNASQSSLHRQLRALTDQSERLQSVFRWQLALLGALCVALAALFIVAILKPVKQINRSITRLGKEQFSAPIEVDGPDDLRHIGERLDWLRQRLQDVERQKNEFVRHMSHELKTPLANIRESTALLLEEAVGETSTAQKEILSIIDSSSRRLHRLVDNLINFARWQEQRAQTTTTFDLSQLVDNQIKEHRLLLERKQLRLDIRRPDELIVSADQERIATLIANLLSNAIKYSPSKGEVKLVIGCEDTDATIDVMDEGPGIPVDERQSVFEPFFQGRRASSSVEGTGIGLSLVKECIEVHGGSGEFLDSTRGAHFRAVLPILKTGRAAKNVA